MHFPQQNVLAVGDVIPGEGWPACRLDDGRVGWRDGWRSAARAEPDQREDADRAGRGPVLGLEDLKKQFDMYQTLYDRLTQLLNKGRGPSEAVEARPAGNSETQWGNADEFVRRSFESLWAYLSPDA